jgi:predicted RNA-binding protein YlqC (UPF0109 family)
VAARFTQCTPFLAAILSRARRPPPERAAEMKELIEYIAKALVDDPDQVYVREIVGGTSVIYELSVAPEDMGRIIGKQGRVANALRTLLKAAAARQGKRVILEIV